MQQKELILYRIRLNALAFNGIHWYGKRVKMNSITRNAHHNKWNRPEIRKKNQQRRRRMKMINAYGVLKLFNMHAPFHLYASFTWDKHDDDGKTRSNQMHSPILRRLFFLLIYHASELGINENLLTNGEKQKIIQSVTRLNCNKAQAMAMLQTEIQLTYSKWEEWRSREWGGMNERAEKKCVRPRAYLLWYTTPNNSSFLKVPSVKWPSMTPK